MKNRAVTLLFALLAMSELSAQQLFVLFDPGCMLRVEYEQAIAHQPRMEYYAYQIPLANGQTLVLETGVEGNVKQNYLPPDYLRCNDPRLNAALAESVNSNTAKLFILLPSGNDYLIQPVAMAAVLAVQNNLLTYVSPLASFQFDTRNVIIGENLSYNNPNAKVFFEGREPLGCSGRYLVRQLMPRNAYPVIDYKMSPLLGVLERRLGSDGQTTVGGATMLRRVNGQPLEEFIAVYCASTAAVPTTASQATTAPTTDYAAVPATYGTTSVAPPAAYAPQPPTSLQALEALEAAEAVRAVSPPSNVPTAPTTTAPTAAATNKPHIVAKGETLYGLSRRYQVSISQLQQWNNLQGNNIRLGQSLVVSQPAYTAVATAPATTESKGTVVMNTPAAPQPVRPAEVASAPVVDQGHIVQPGETVASIALRYGYTEAKYREINGLGNNEFIRIGQRLKTNDCNCPVANAPATTAPSAYGGGAVTPSAYVAPTPYGTPSGTPVGPTANTNSPIQLQQYGSMPAQPQQYGTNYGTTPVQQPQPYGTNYGSTPAQPQQYGTVPTAPAAVNINNDPSFGQKGVIVPQNYQAPTANQSMNSLEGGGARIGGTQLGSSPTTYYGQPVTNASPVATRAVHVVQEGESLYSIANRYGLTVDLLRGLNGLGTTDIIIPFQRLYIN